MGAKDHEELNKQEVNVVREHGKRSVIGQEERMYGMHMRCGCDSEGEYLQ